MDRELDNPVWHALLGVAPALAERAGHAARFIPAVAPFFAIDRASDAAYADLRGIIGSAPEARLFRPGPEPAPPGWTKTFEKPILQMLLPPDVALPRSGAPIEVLGPADAPAMLALAESANPGPFAARTHELGAFLGLRENGALVAMAGERFNVPGCTEISAVATHPSQRGRGYGRVLTVELAHRIRAAGRTPFLHVFADNVPAAKLYRSIGFTVRRELTIVWLAPE